MTNRLPHIAAFALTVILIMSPAMADDAPTPGTLSSEATGMLAKAQQLKAKGQFLTTPEIIAALQEKSFRSLEVDGVATPDLTVYFYEGNTAFARSGDDSVTSYWGAGNDFLCAAETRETIYSNCNYRLFRVGEGYVFLGFNDGKPRNGVIIPLQAMR